MQPVATVKSPVEVQVVTSNVELIQNIYNVIERTYTCHRQRRPYMVIGLSGGSLIKTLAEVLPSLRDEYLKAARFIFCDERRVPFDDPESTYGEYMRVVFPRIRDVVSEDQFIKIDPTLSVNECASDYERKLRDLVGDESEWPQVDIALVGLGPDGHTCSLFPNSPVLQEKERWVAPVHDSPKPPPERVTLTLPVLNHARRVVFVATGAGKADVVKTIMEGSDQEKAKYPPAMIKPVRPVRCRARMCWILDRDAAGKLTQVAKQ